MSTGCEPNQGGGGGREGRGREGREQGSREKGPLNRVISADERVSQNMSPELWSHPGRANGKWKLAILVNRIGYGAFAPGKSRVGEESLERSWMGGGVREQGPDALNTEQTGKGKGHKRRGGGTRRGGIEKAS